MYVVIRFASVSFVALALTQAQGAPPNSLSSHQNQAKTAKAITAILNTQANAWNAADIPEFMKYYWKSDKLTFSSGGTTRRGWQATLESYQKKYPTPEKMGKLRFSDLEIDQLGTDVALVLGKWQLKRAKDPDIGGNFSLVFRRIDGRWLIIHDHSSALENPKQQTNDTSTP